MKALVLDGEARLCDVPKPERKPGEALIRVLAAGVCRTDLELARGYMGFTGIPGHEFVGEVMEADTFDLLGRRVVGEINCVCGTCKFCQLELPHHCLNRSVLGILNRSGAFAEYLTLPEANLHIVPNPLPDEVAVFTEPLAAAYRILEQVDIGSDNRVVVLGDGRLGQLIAQVLWQRTKKLVCVGRHRWKLQLLQQLNIPTALAVDPVERGADFVIESTGAFEGLQRSFDLVRPEGTVVLKTTTTHPTAMEMSLPVINEIRIIGSRCGPFRPALEALSLGNVEVTPMISATYDLQDAVTALHRAAQGDVLKVVISMR